VTRSEQIAGRSLCAAVYRTATLALVVLAVLGALGAVFLSPLALSRVPAAQGIDWSRLGDVGQTYGAASALLSVFALGGVAVSLHLQRRESKAAREQALRGLHTDLLRMALEDATFLECWGPIGESTDVGWYRQHIYLNLVVSHWQMMWEIGAITERHLRLTAGDLSVVRSAGVTGARRGTRGESPKKVGELEASTKLLTVPIKRPCRIRQATTFQRSRRSICTRRRNPIATELTPRLRVRVPTRRGRVSLRTAHWQGAVIRWLGQGWQPPYW
jgi:hypothetical protein